MTKGLNWIPVRGDCMWPALRSGDHAEWAPSAGPPLPGSVVVARCAGTLVAHRVVRVAGGSVLLQGDNLRAPDAPVPREAVLGVVERVHRGERTLTRAEWDLGPRWTGRLRMRVRGLARRFLGEAP